MPNFIIKTHQKSTVYKANKIFIINKGMNSGKWSVAEFINTKNIY